MFALTRSLSKRFTKGLDNVFYRPNKAAKKDFSKTKNKENVEKNPLKSSETKEVEVEKQMTRCKPDGLEALCHSTKFTRKELQIMYRGFKNECPSGMVNEETFKYIYSQFFPQGDCTAYAHFVFNTFDQDHSGTISFEEFVMGLSLLLRGSLLEKLQWVFSLYDVNHDGVITTDELHMVVSSVYDVMGKFCNPKIDESSIDEHVQTLFEKLDVDRDGVISFEEFINTCYNDKMITNSIAVFDTVF